MTSWLEHARMESAALLSPISSAHGQALRARIDARLRRRRVVRGAALGASAAGVIALALLLPKPSFDSSASPTARKPVAAVPAPQPALPAWQLAGGSRAQALAADTALAIERDDAEGARIALGTGTARFEVRPRAHAPFVVRAGEVSVHVTGTVFRVTRTAAAVEVMVEEGTVEVLAYGERTPLRAGQARVFEALAAPEPASQAGRRAEPRREAGDAAGELLARADDARREGRTQDALAALRELIGRHARDPRAPSAAFSLGRLLLERERDAAGAAAAFARVAELDPHSPLVEDALAREIEARARAGQAERVRALAQRYLARYPRGARAAFVRSHAGVE